MSLASQSLHRLLHVVFLLRLLLSSSWAPKWYAKAVSSPKCQDVVWCWILAICLCLGGIFGEYYTTSGDKRPAAVTLSKRQDSLCKRDEEELDCLVNAPITSSQKILSSLCS